MFGSLLTLYLREIIRVSKNSQLGELMSNIKTGQIRLDYMYNSTACGHSYKGARAQKHLHALQLQQLADHQITKNIKNVRWMLWISLFSVQDYL